jgi:mRNA-degrading endonuclease toxin of MazEF toxin-antitoxin module
MYKQRDIVIMPFYFSEGSKKQKIRPVLVLSNDTYNSENSDFVACMITSRLKFSKFSFLIRSEDLESGVLLKNSIIRSDKLLTCEQKKVHRKVGTLSKKQGQIVLEHTKNLFNLNPLI